MTAAIADLAIALAVAFLLPAVSGALTLRARHWRNGRLVAAGLLPFRDCVYPSGAVRFAAMAGVVAALVAAVLGFAPLAAALPVAGALSALSLSSALVPGLRASPAGGRRDPGLRQ